MAESVTYLDRIRRLWAHGRWADAAIEGGLTEAAGVEGVEEALREYAHVLGAQEVWLARLQGRPSTQPVWPKLGLTDAAALRRNVATSYADYLAGLVESDLEVTVSYENSAGRSFETPVGEILTHVALHGQYHRGKINRLLRDVGSAPKPVDYIAFVRGAPAAVTPPDE